MATEEKEPICENCNWYTPSHAGTHGYCRRFPPVFTHLDDNNRPRFYNPTTSPHNYCGEFEDID